MMYREGLRELLGASAIHIETGVVREEWHCGCAIDHGATETRWQSCPFHAQYSKLTVLQAPFY